MKIRKPAKFELSRLSYYIISNTKNLTRNECECATNSSFLIFKELFPSYKFLF